MLVSVMLDIRLVSSCANNDDGGRLCNRSIGPGWDALHVDGEVSGDGAVTIVSVDSGCLCGVSMVALTSVASVAIATCELWLAVAVVTDDGDFVGALPSPRWPKKLLNEKSLTFSSYQRGSVGDWRSNVIGLIGVALLYENTACFGMDL